MHFIKNIETMKLYRSRAQLRAFFD